MIGPSGSADGPRLRTPDVYARRPEPVPVGEVVARAEGEGACGAHPVGRERLARSHATVCRPLPGRIT